MALWSGQEFAGHQFYDYAKNEDAELWVAEDGGVVIGKLYLFKELPDNDFANGKNRAYITNFSIHFEYRGRGIGTKMMEQVFTSLSEAGFAEITIGVDEGELRNVSLYKKMGFSEKIRLCYADPICTDDNGVPFEMSEFLLLMRTL